MQLVFVERRLPLSFTILSNEGNSNAIQYKHGAKVTLSNDTELVKKDLRKKWAAVYMAGLKMIVERPMIYICGTLYLSSHGYLLPLPVIHCGPGMHRANGRPK